MNSLYDHGVHKFPDAGLLASSRARGWKGMAAELRSHPACAIPDICSTQTEITFAVRGAKAGSVHRRGNGRLQVAPSRSGTIWVCPKGVSEDQIRITEAIPEVLHVYIPDHQIASLSVHTSRPVVFDENFYQAGLEDEFVRQICVRINSELQEETAGGAVMMEYLANVLVTHICGRFADRRIVAETPSNVGALDSRRFNRVRDYIEENLSSDLTITEIAAVACLSRHHFARAFRAAAGESPSSYIGARRIDRACNLLATSEMSLAEIALVCRFSSQAAFARAFKRQSGHSPGEYRRTSQAR
ncbi:helix-turn-helix domain-containing protein [Pararhizobium qamdonense]|uniref:helix-turn-helix domain-containing protein n=1 Tax=Pararhizobium qamdonense TaxID=3031126 RepID=UPI0023E0DD39|nr:AraC family transcriptional regulator [Pararhizobium qamdonense]